jgi:NDP-sugar pyrophosphorylase family protein
MTVEQCVFLVGGVGSRLGPLTRDRPKPMLPVAGQPFLAHLLAKAARHGFRRILLLAGFRAEVITDWLAASGVAERLGLRIDLMVEPEPLGTGGAVAHAADRLDETFLLANGDTWFDFDWRALADDDSAPVAIALRAADNADRHETVTLDQGRVTGFNPRSGRSEPGVINGGVYRIARSALEPFRPPLSLEADILPALAARAQVRGRLFDGPFIDIGLPESLAAAENIVKTPSN